MYYYARLISKASVYKLFSELYSATSCLLYADTVPLKMKVSWRPLSTIIMYPFPYHSLIRSLLRYFCESVKIIIIITLIHDSKTI